MTKMRYLLAMALLLLSVSSCTNDNTETCPVDEGACHSATMVLNMPKAEFDLSTKSAAGWQDGNVVYLLFANGNGNVQGKAVYQAGSAVWTVNYSGNLQRDAETRVSVWYFENAGTETSDAVTLTASTGVYADAEGQYVYPTDGELVVTGRMKPVMGRMRFKGTAGMNITVKGIRHTTSYSVSSGLLTFSDEPVSLKVQTDGYTPYLYGTFTDAETREMTIAHEEGTFSTECSSTMLQTAKSGWMDIPTADAHNGWLLIDRFNGHAYVDLGLTSGTLWATCNVGASKPEEYGDYFAWGETTGYNSGKTNFDWSTYKWCNGSYNTMTKYCTSSSRGTVDNKKELELSDDAARANWGNHWRMPSSAQIDELISECNTEWTTQNGVYGRKVTSKKNGKSIFLPAAGYRDASFLFNDNSYGNYWSRSLDENYCFCAYSLGLDSSVFDRDSGSDARNYGYSVRPVVSE